MLRLIIAATMCVGAGAANASSIEPFNPTASKRTSIIEIGCPSCAREAEAKAKAEAETRLAPGEQIVEVREIAGQQMIYRTENLLGGSPVTMVRKASEADLIALGVKAPKVNETAEADEPLSGTNEQQVASGAEGKPALFEPVMANSAPGIDEDTKTSALGEDPAKAFDPSKFELRLN